MFEVYPESGFKVTFKNGYTISVIWHAGSYSDRRNPSKTAEVAVWDKDGNDYQFPGHFGWQTPEQVANWFNVISSLKEVN